MADISDLQSTLKEILAAIKHSAGGGSVSSTGGGKGFGPQSLKDYFTQGAMKGARGGLGIQQAMGGMAGKLGQASGMGGAAAGALGKIGGPLVMIGKELATLPWKVKDFAEGLHNANRQFAQYSGPMSAVMAQSDMADMIRKMRQGDQLASSAGGLAKARGRLLDQLAPIETQAQRFQNNLGQATTNVVSKIFEKPLKGLDIAMTKGNDLLEDIGKKLGVISNEPVADAWVAKLEQHVKDTEKRQADRIKPVRPERGARQAPWEGRNRADF